MSSPAYYDLPYRAVAHAHYVYARLRTVEFFAVNGEARHLCCAAVACLDAAYPHCWLTPVYILMKSTPGKSTWLPSSSTAQPMSKSAPSSVLRRLSA